MTVDEEGDVSAALEKNRPVLELVAVVVVAAVLEDEDSRRLRLLMYVGNSCPRRRIGSEMARSSMLRILEATGEE